MVSMLDDDAIFVNSRYQVNLKHLKKDDISFSCDVIHLSIKSRDKEARHDWRDLQRIKNEIVGPQYEAVEIYPKEEFLVDTANQYHLWVFHDESISLPFGFRYRLVWDKGSSGSKQRPFNDDNRPADCQTMTDEKIRAIIEKGKENEV
jgi:hypothetical protein